MRTVTKRRIKKAAKLVAGLFGWESILWGTVVVMIALKFMSQLPDPMLIDDTSRIREQIMRHDLNNGRGGF